MLLIPIDEVEQRPITEYWSLWEQAINVGRWRAGGELNLETNSDEMEKFRKQLEYAIKEGCLGKRRETR